MLYYDQENLADLFIELDALGYGGDPPPTVRLDGWPTEASVLSDFRVKSRQLREARARLEYCLVEKLVTGKLVARGYSSQAAPDEPAKNIVADLWRALVPDFDRSEASGTGHTIVGVLVFREPLQRAQRSKARFALAAVRSWYEKRVKLFTKEGEVSSRDEDLEAAKQEFGSEIPRDIIRSLRRELAPPEWTRLGRRKRV